MEVKNGLGISDPLALSIERQQRMKRDLNCSSADLQKIAILLTAFIKYPHGSSKDIGTVIEALPPHK